MEEPTQTQPVEAEPVFNFSMRNLDQETIDLLVDDKIATGG